MRYAVIDLGTNTFNLLIIDTREGNNFSVLFDDKVEAKIGKGGINNSLITKEAFQRGVQRIGELKSVIDSYRCDKAFAFGTSALRNASNGNDFINTVKEQHDISVQLISGEEEAELIYIGNKHSISIDENFLILDIGGGSNEFIIANHDEILWKRSFELGMQRLLHLFSPSDPITDNEIEAIEKYLEANLTELHDAIQKYPCSVLVGSSGAFDTFRDVILLQKGLQHKAPSYLFDFDDYKQLHHTFTRASQAELAKIDGMDMMRIEMISVASVLVNFIIKHLSIKTLIQSSYSLKEGVVYKYLLS